MDCETPHPQPQHSMKNAFLTIQVAGGGVCVRASMRVGAQPWPLSSLFLMSPVKDSFMDRMLASNNHAFLQLLNIHIHT